MFIYGTIYVYFKNGFVFLFSGGMQRSASQRQVKKVNVPVVPDIPGVNGGSGVVPPPPFVTTNLSSSSSRQSSSSYGSWPYVDGCETSTTISNAANGILTSSFY